VTAEFPIRQHLLGRRKSNATLLLRDRYAEEIPVSASLRPVLLIGVADLRRRRPEARYRRPVAKENTFRESTIGVCSSDSNKFMRRTS